MKQLAIEPLTKESFAPFGDVIDTSNTTAVSINKGLAQSFQSLTRIDVTDGHVIANIYQSKAPEFPLEIRMMERHPFGSQAFIPMNCQQWLLVVATGDEQAPVELKAFLAEAHQGINYRAGTWHYPLLSLHDGDTFVVIDRNNPAENLHIHKLADNQQALLHYTKKHD